MLKVAVVVLMFFVIWILEYVVCFLWCLLRRRKERIKKYNTENQASTDTHINNKKNVIMQKMILCLDGFILYKLKCVGKYPLGKLRVFLLKHVFLMNIQKNVTIYAGFEIRAPWNITIGEGTIIGNECKLDGRNGIVIGKNVNLSTGVWIWTQQHDYNAEDFGLDTREGQVIVEDYAWLSGRTILLPGVKIGKGAVAATGAVVTKALEPYGVYGGVPAKYICKRNDKLSYEFSGEHLGFI